MTINNKERFEKIIESLMSRELECRVLFQHLKRQSNSASQQQHQNQQNLLNNSHHHHNHNHHNKTVNEDELLNESLLSRSINPAPVDDDDEGEDEDNEDQYEGDLLDDEVNHDFILFFMNLVHAEANNFLPIRTNANTAANVMSPNKNILNLTFNEQPQTSAATATTVTQVPLTMSQILTQSLSQTPTTPSGEPKRIYPRSIKPQQVSNNSPRGGANPAFQNSFESHNSSVCSTPRHHAYNGGGGTGGGNRLTRNYSSLSCQSSPGFDNSPRQLIYYPLI